MAELLSFLNGGSIWVYVFIFFGKIFEVAVATLRIVLINRGVRIVGSLVALFEMTLWLIVTGTVLNGFQSDPIKIVVFVLAFAIGNFIGSWLDEKLAFGLSAIQVVVHDQHSANNLMTTLRENGFGVTTMEVQGKEDVRYMLMLTLRRKSAKEALGIIERTCSHALITMSDVKTQKGGYMRASSARRLPPFMRLKKD